MVIAALYGGVALGGEWKPNLGLDLQGGTSITLEAQTPSGGKPPKDQLDEARSIIDQRVNGSGVAEASVATQGDRNIVVEVPGKNPKGLVDTVKQTAQLRFRLVALSAPGTPQPKPSASPSAVPSGSPSASPSAGPSGKPTASTPSAKPKGRALSGGLLSADTAKKPKAAKPSPSSAPSASPLPAAPSAAPTGAPQTTKQGAPVSDPLKWMDNPGDVWVKKFAAYTCPTKGSPGTLDVPGQPLITCDDHGTKYLLSAAMIEGTQLTRAEAGIPQNQVQWVVDLTFNSVARTTFATVTQQIQNATSPLTGQQKQFAIVLDGKVISAPVVNSAIPNGQAQISGNFSQTEAQSLANSLKYGALPLKFKVPVVSEEGPTLAGDQLHAGLMAGAVGLFLVLVYCLLYYRGLGIVVLASLVVAAVITYAVVLVMSKAAGFTLT
ncbi:MAG: preprotein translocase subunit SecD, partial [Nocardioides sp.]